ncbi:MAG: L,D-transpeptidase family protein [Ferruginibacter sp.]
MHSPAKEVFCITVSLLICFISCKPKHIAKAKDVVVDLSKMDSSVAENISGLLASAENASYRLPDSTTLSFYPVLNYYYSNEEGPIWSSRAKWKTAANALMTYIENAHLQGLYKEDYGFSKIDRLKRLLDSDSVTHKDAVQWAVADLMLTDALCGLLKDLKQGRLQPDSQSMKFDTAMYRNYFAVQINKIRNGALPDSVLAEVEPKHTGYRLLKSGIKAFTDSMDTKEYTYLAYPYKDTSAFRKLFRKRMDEAGVRIAEHADSAELATAVKRYQRSAGIIADGKIGNGVVKSLNMTDGQRFKIIALTLDRYKALPAKMPEKYIWVNLPGYYLRVWSADTVVFESKVICGKPGTRTPILTGAISDMIIYPTWTVPSSIISKEMLPGLKRNTNYLSRKGLYLLDNDGERVDPASIEWARFSKGIPYRVQQGSGDNNALGVIKFNFSNPYDVYLHDTNQRYLFKKSVRSLSHGCVRVQEWEKLANFIVQTDSILAKRTDTLKYTTDSIRIWIANKERHKIEVKNRLPLFIRYFSCEYVKGTIRFYDDIYGEDRALAQKYFAGK